VTELLSYKYKPFARLRFQPVSIWTIVIVSALSAVFTPAVWAQKEVTSKALRYRGLEKSTGRYEKYEVKPRLYQPHVPGRRPRAELMTLAPTAEKVRFRKYLADTHVGLRFYERRTCVSCHPQQARSMHAVRARITCRQCHGDEPIPGNSHYAAPMHPRKRYAYVCAKCHKGSSPSFATYRVHEPNPLSFDTRKAFPVLFYAFWFMVILAVGTFAAFIPHTLSWGLREFLPPTFRIEIRRYLPGKKKRNAAD
jgi:hypothetical protein